MMKKVLILRWNSVNENTGIIEAFKEMGMEYTIVDLNGQDCRADHEEFFSDFFRKNRFDLVYSTNYFSYLADNCHIHGIPYIAWAYDSPARLDTVDKLGYDTNHIFLFDSYEVDRYRERDGLNNVHYLPLAADTDRFEYYISAEKDQKKYESDISFVGGLYDSKINEYLNLVSDYKKAFFNAIVDHCTGRYDECVIETMNLLNLFYWEEEREFIEKVVNDKRSGSPVITSDESEKVSLRVARLASNLATNRERLILISMLSNHWKFKLYSTSSHEVFKSTIECGEVDYYTEMPNVFRNSRINLNITNKGIKAGMPLRCLDIMGSGGLLLTNYQKDFEEHFRDGDNILIYHNFDEAYEKCDFYLSHEDIRDRIARKGYETVKDLYNYRVLIRKAIDMADLGYLFK